MFQPSLFDAIGSPGPFAHVVCAYGNTGVGWDGPHHCAACAAAVEAARAEFRRRVEAGEWNAAGYTPSEWKRAGYPAETWKDARRCR